MALSDGLIAYWKLEENAANTTVADSKGTHTGTASTNTSDLTVAGKVNNAFDLVAASSECVTIPGAGDLEFGDVDFSISFWMYPDSNASFTCPLMKSTAYATQKVDFGFFFGGDNKMNFGIGDQTDSSVVVSTNAIAAGAWYHVVGTYDASESDLFLYINTAKTSNASAARNHVASGASVILGQFFSGNGKYDGKVDEVAIWNRCLTDAEVDSLYNGGNGTVISLGPDFSKLQLNISDSWKAGAGMQINIGDSWKQVASSSINIGDSWKTIF